MVRIDVGELWYLRSPRTFSISALEAREMSTQRFVSLLLDIPEAGALRGNQERLMLYQ